MAVLSNIAFIILGIIILGFISKDAAASGGFNITIPFNRKISSLTGKRCLALRWNGVCSNVADCKTKLHITLIRQSTAAINNVPLFHPFTSGSSQAVCFYDDITGESESCCNEIIQGLSTGNALSFGDYEKIKFKIFTCHTKDNYSQCSAVESSFLLPWHDACFLFKPCGDEGSCKNDLKPGYFNCSCFFDWKGDNCTIPKDFNLVSRKCLKDVVATEELVNKTMKECVKRCKDLGNTKCKSFEFKVTVGRQGNCSIKDSNSLNHKLVDCTSDYFEIRTEDPTAQGTSVTAMLAMNYMLFSFFIVFLNDIV